VTVTCVDDCSSPMYGEHIIVHRLAASTAARRALARRYLLSCYRHTAQYLLPDTRTSVRILQLGSRRVDIRTLGSWNDSVKSEKIPTAAVVEVKFPRYTRDSCQLLYITRQCEL